MKVKVAQLCPTLCHPMDCTVHGILQARILEWAAFLFSRGSSQPRDQTQVSHIAGGFFTNWAMREATNKTQHNLKYAVLTLIVRTTNQWVNFVLSHWLVFMQTLEKIVYQQIWGYIWRTCQWVIDYDVCSSVLIFLKLKYAQVKKSKSKNKNVYVIQYSVRDQASSVWSFIHSTNIDFYVCWVVGSSLSSFI